MRGLILANIRHYAAALWGFRQRLDPDYPAVECRITREAVLEYRVYGLIPLLGASLSYLLPEWALHIMCGIWAGLAFWRAGFYRSDLEFWRRAAAESPNKQRCAAQLAFAAMREAEAEMKRGGQYEGLMVEANEALCKATEWRAVERIVEQSGRNGRPLSQSKSRSRLALRSN